MSARDLHPALTVLIVAESAPVRALLRAVVERLPNFRVAGDATDRIEAVTLAIGLQPDVVLIDLAMPLADGLGAVPSLLSEVPGCRIIVLSGLDPGWVAGQLEEVRHQAAAARPNNDGAGIRSEDVDRRNGSTVADVCALNVLLIEDNADHALLVETMLTAGSNSGFVVSSRSTVASACEDGSVAQADCILLDLSLPDANDLEGLERLRASGCDRPVIVLTARADEQLALAAMKAGAQDYLIKGEVDGCGLARAIRYAIERRSRESDLVHRAFHDELTGLPSRSLLLDRLDASRARLARIGGAVAVVFVDLDHFKEINDTHGHEAGDRVLQRVANRLRRAARSSDTVARVGGDEFVVVCEGIKNDDNVGGVVSRIQDAVAAPIALDDTMVEISASLGVALTHTAEDAPQDLLRRADVAMYHAKRERRVLTPRDAVPEQA